MLRSLLLFSFLSITAACTSTVVGTGEDAGASQNSAEPPAEVSNDSPGAASSSAPKPKPSPSPSTTSSSDAGSPSLNLSGMWRGNLDDGEGVYFDIFQTGSTVSGVLCEAPNKDCMAIREGLLLGDRFRAFVSWTETDGDVQSLTVDLRVSSDGKKLAGTATATKRPGVTLGVALNKLVL